MIRYRREQHSDSNADLKALMTAEPMSAETHAQIMRKKVEARRRIEDARDRARHEQSDFVFAAT